LVDFKRNVIFSAKYKFGNLKGHHHYINMYIYHNQLL